MAGDPLRVAVERVKRFLAEYRPRWLYVMWSGGKDSTAALVASITAAREAGIPVKAVYVIVPGQTHPDNTVVVLEVWRRLCPGCPIHYAAARTPSELRRKILETIEEPGDALYVTLVLGPRGREFWMGVEKWGVPTPIPRPGARWCRYEFKQRAWDALPPNAMVDGRPARVLVVGVRRGESAYRSRRWPEHTPVTTYETRSGILDVALSPIYDMSEEDVWKILEEAGVAEPIRRLYEKWAHHQAASYAPSAAQGN